MRTILPPTGDYDLRVFLPLVHGHMHLYVKFKETIPDRTLADKMTTQLQKRLLFPYLRTLHNLDPQVPVLVDTWEMLCTVCRSK